MFEYASAKRPAKPNAANLFARALALAFCLAALLASSAAEAERRVALVIGQSQYASVPKLENPAHDARLIADALAKLNFEIVGGAAQFDLDKAHFDAALAQFSNQVQGADVALVYYAGHGVQEDGENFLVPVDAHPARPGDVYLQMVAASVILKQLEGAGTKLNIILLDACRNDPFGSRAARGVGGGLAQMRAPEGTLISYATQPGNVALDGDKGDSPYTLALAQAIEKPGVGLFETFNDVGLAVKRATNGVQQPWVSSSPIEGGFFFAGPQATAPIVARLDTESDNSTVSRASNAQAAKPNPEPQPQIPTDPIAACDVLAAGPRDTQLPPGVRGIDIADLDPEKAIAACKAAVAAQPKLGRAMFEYARALTKAGQFDEAAKWLKNGAAAGSFSAMEGLGFISEIGKSVPRDIPAALAWYKKAADGGNGPAMQRIALLYARGLGVTQDDSQAFSWSLKAANTGDAPAMVSVGRALEDGRGVARNKGEAFGWYRMGAEAGNWLAMTRLGLCYAKGEGVGRNPAEAATWYRKAADMGFKEAMLKLADAYETGEGVEKSEEQANLWRRKAKE